MTNPRVARAILAASMLGCSVVSWAQTQSLVPSVQWRASVQADASDSRGRRARLEVAAIVPLGWHVYALNEPQGGPTPLRIAIERGVTAKITGTASGATPEKRHDPSFDLDTEFYSHDFTLSFPVESQGAIRTIQSLPVSVRFQLCSERECQPPKTIHLLAALNEAPST